MNYKQLLESAASAGACEEHLSIARQYNSFKKAMKDPQAPYWAYWYASDVIKGRWPEAFS